MEVVDREQERSASGEVRCQPVQPVERRQRRVGSGLRNEQLGVEERLGQRRCPREDVGALLHSDRGEERLEELPHDAVRERPLELGAARSEAPASRPPGPAASSQSSARSCRCPVGPRSRPADRPRGPPRSARQQPPARRRARAAPRTPARSFLGSVYAARKRLRFELRWLHEANERLVPARWIHVIRSRS
jgi:hypothetical protein